MISENGLDTRHLELVAELATRISILPAVATQDWCARAADVVRGLRPSAVVSVTIAGVGSGGEIAFIEASGAAGLDIQGKPLDGSPVHPDHANSLGWWFASGDNTVRAASLRNLPCGPEWPTTSSARRWSRLGVAELGVGAAPIPGNIVGRTLIVEIGVSDAERGLDKAELSVLRAALPLLARRAALAFGAEVSSPLTRLTVREQEVLEHLALGKSVKEIAEDLSRSPHTVHDHVKSLHRKLNASSRGELIARTLGHVSGSHKHEGVHSESERASAEPLRALNRPGLSLMTA
jgi:DNA-binding CsgD family transcriptional regulator